jgi:TPR repeat protein
MVNIVPFFRLFHSTSMKTPFFRDHRVFLHILCAFLMLFTTACKQSFEQRVKQAETGDARVQFDIAEHYDFGIETQRNSQEALRWYKLSADAQYTPAEAVYGEILRSGETPGGHEISVNTDLALTYTQRASQKQHPVGLYNLGVHYKYGIGIPKDSSKAQQLFAQAFPLMKNLADSGWFVAIDDIANMYSLGYGTQTNDSIAFQWYRKSAEQGNVTAQLRLGGRYAYGDGVPKDATEAVKWYRKAAEQGNAYAQFKLGEKYYFGEGVPKDATEAVKWYRKSAEQGKAYAQFNLGEMYRDGKGVPKDATEAVKWYRKSAEQGDADAQFVLGVIYANGEGVPKDATEAVKWYRKSAEQGYASAQYNLGVMYGNGEGVPKDATEAVKWYRKAAEKGYADAQLNLGAMYANGTGVEKNMVLALAWQYVAKVNQDKMFGEGQQILATNIQINERKLNSTARSQAEQMAKKLYDQIYKK